LIEGERLADLLAQQYDFVVFDSGAVLEPDAVSLMKMVGNVLVVGRLDVTSREQAVRFRDDLRLMNVPTLGVIANRANRRFRFPRRRSQTSPEIASGQPLLSPLPRSEHEREHASVTND
jgi:Mrp family chromosome partitioning ATPase